MNYLKLIIALFLTLTTSLDAKELEKISLQLMWLDQFQFAGYYMAKEKGFYEDAGLDVELKKYSKYTNVLEEVLSKRATYGIGRSSLIVDKSEGKGIVLLSSIFQSSPAVLLARKDSSIQTVKDFVGKKTMITPDNLNGVSLLAMMKKEGVREKDLIKLQHSFDINDLINKKTDLMASYISNEPFILKQKGVEFTVFDPKDHGFSFYSDILFTSEEEIEHNHQRAIDFKKASLQGWKYAFEHVDETIALILQKYNIQNKSKEALEFEAKELEKLAYYKGIPLGTIDKNKIQRIYDIYNVLGIVKNNLDIDAFIFCNHPQPPFTKAEEEYINKKVLVKYSFYSKIKAIAWINELGEESGVLTDFMKLIEQKSGLKLVYEKSNNAELLTAIDATIANKKLFHFTQGKLFSSPYVFVSKHEEYFENGFVETKNKKIGIVKDSLIQEELKRDKPNLKPILLEDVNEAFETLDKGGVNGIIVNALSAKYYILALGYENLDVFHRTKFQQNFKIAFSKDVAPELSSIIEKALSMITQKEVDDILYKWTNVKVVKNTDWKVVWKMIGIFTLIIVVIVFFFTREYRLKKKIKSLNTMLQNKVYLQMVEQNILLSLFDKGDTVLFNWRNDDDWSVGFVSLSVKNLFGYEKEEFESGKVNYKSCIYPEDLEMILAEVKNFSKSGTEFFKHAPYRIVTKSDQIRWVFDYTTTVRDENNEITNYVGIISDITDLKQKESQLLQQSKLAQMGDMISMIAHQWRQPLNAISASSIHLSLLSTMSKLEPQKLQESSKFIQAQCQKMSKTIDTFMNFVKPSQEAKTFKLSDTVDSILCIMGTQLMNHNIKVTINKTKENISVFGFEDLLEQVIINLLSNARDAFDESRGEDGALTNVQNKYIAITITQENDFALIRIEDNAGGIPENIRDKICNPYFTTKKQGKGTGLGLYMSLNIMKKSFDGDLSYRATEGGSMFDIVFKGDASNVR